MHPFLTRLGISLEVQQFFSPFIGEDHLGNLVFKYGDGQEHYGFAFHHIPVSAQCWMAGNLNFTQVRMVIISSSALDAVSWLNKKTTLLSGWDNLLFLSLGATLTDSHFDYLSRYLNGKSYYLIFSNDLLGHLADVKLSAAIRQQPLRVYAKAEEKLSINFRARNYSFQQGNFSLSSFEKKTKYRFYIRTEKPKHHLTFFDELKAEALHTF